MQMQQVEVWSVFYRQSCRQFCIHYEVHTTSGRIRGISVLVHKNILRTVVMHAWVSVFNVLYYPLMIFFFFFLLTEFFSIPRWLTLQKPLISCIKGHTKSTRFAIERRCDALWQSACLNTYSDRVCSINTLLNCRVLGYGPSEGAGFVFLSAADPAAKASHDASSHD